MPQTVPITQFCTRLHWSNCHFFRPGPNELEFHYHAACSLRINSWPDMIDSNKLAVTVKFLCSRDQSACTGCSKSWCCATNCKQQNSSHTQTPAAETLLRIVDLGLLRVYLGMIRAPKFT